MCTTPILMNVAFLSLKKRYIWLPVHTHMKVKAGPSRGSLGIPVLKHNFLCSLHQHFLVLVKTGQVLRILSTVGNEFGRATKTVQIQGFKTFYLVLFSEEVFSPPLKTSRGSLFSITRVSESWCMPCLYLEGWWGKPCLRLEETIRVLETCVIILCDSYLLKVHASLK